MSKTDAQRSLEIYRSFTRQTDHVVQYLSVARLHEHHTRVEVPKLKHAPVNLSTQLEEYLEDADFEVHRRQYLAEREAKKKGGSSRTAKLDFPKTSTRQESTPAPNLNNPFPSVPDAKTDIKPQANKGPDPDLIDFFDSIEQNQTTMQVNNQPTGMPGAAPFQTQPTGMQFPQNGFAPQQTGFAPNNMFQQQQNMGGFMQQQPQQQPQLQQQQQPQPQLQQLQPNFTGAGFGGFTPQPSFQPGALGSIPQNSEATFQHQNQGFQYGQPQQQPQQPQQQLQPLQTGQLNPLQPMQTGTNPFRQSMMMQQTGIQVTSPYSSPPPAPQLSRQSTNPFARSPPQSSSPFQSAPPMPIQAQPTGTNPFAKNIQQQQQQPMQSPDQSQNQGALAPQPTGTTNPFRHGAFVNHNTGMGWQHNQTNIGGGLDQLPTMPVFPRPAQQTPWQQ